MSLAPYASNAGMRPLTDGAKTVLLPEASMPSKAMPSVELAAVWATMASEVRLYCLSGE